MILMVRFIVIESPADLSMYKVRELDDMAKILPSGAGL